MDFSEGNSVLTPVLFAYGFLVLVYLFILKLLIDTLQQLGNKHAPHKSVVDADIRRTMTPRVDESMHTYNVYGVAVVIAKAGITVIGMAILIVLSVVKFGVLPTILLLVTAVMTLWLVRNIMRKFDKSNLMKMVHAHSSSSASIGSVLLLGIALVGLVFIMIFIA